MVLCWEWDVKHVHAAGQIGKHARDYRNVNMYFHFVSTEWDEYISVVMLLNDLLQ